MHPIPRLLVVLTLLLAAADTAAAQSQREIVLRVGDVVRINSWRNPELSGDIVVDADGTLRHPLYGGVRAAGVTLSELVGEVRTVLKRYDVEPQFTVEPLFRVQIAGEVRTPNVYMVGPSVSVAQAVAMAGWTTDVASGRATLSRDGHRSHIDLRTPNTASGQRPVQPGDVIVVEKRRNFSMSRWLGGAAALLTALTSAVLVIRLAAAD
jgi:polysaccharide export outer membrane protein